MSDESKPVSPLAAGVRFGSKTTAAEILRMLGELNKESSAALSDISNPLATSGMEVVADYFENECKEEGSANILRGMVVYQRMNVPAKGGKRVKDILEAVKTVLQMEYEVAKSAAKRALP